MRKNLFGKVYDTAKGIAIASVEEDEIEYELYLQKTAREDRWFVLRTFYCGNQEICPLDQIFVKNWIERHGLEHKVNGYLVK
jgi:hypothetical protein